MDSESIDRDWLSETRVHPTGSWMTVDDLGRFRQGTDVTKEEESDPETGKDPESDSNKEQTEEPTAETQGRDILSGREAPQRGSRMQSMFY